MVRARYGTGVFLKFNIQTHEVRTKPPPHPFALFMLLETGFMLFVDLRECASSKAL
jgi:hypothetical protein